MEILELSESELGRKMYKFYKKVDAIRRNIRLVSYLLLWQYKSAEAVSERPSLDIPRPSLLTSVRNLNTRNEASQV